MEKELSCSNYGYFHTNWASQNEQNDQNDPFESALSSMVSSPTTTPSNGCGDGIMIKELIGRLGSICDSSENNINNNYNNNNNNNSSCYNTPINSPKFNLSSLMNMGNNNHTIIGNNNGNYPTNLGTFNADPGFVERAAKFSCFGNNSTNFANNNVIINNNVNHEINNNNNNNNNNGDSREGSSVSEQNPGVELSIKSQNDAKSRKRKSISKAKVKDFTPPIKDDKVEVENDASNAKRSKVDKELSKKENEGECNSSKEKENNIKNDDNNNNNNDSSKEIQKAAEPFKDYIHVRARRGQATDSHSLAERVRREKISERMKFLQDLVPGCNKVTGKATVLDEIINYVQSLQRQVEFLSMKLSTVNPRLEFNMEALLSKDMFHSMYQLDQNSAQALPFAYQLSQQMAHPLLNGIPNGFENPFSVSPMDPTGARRNPNVSLPSIDGFVDSLAQLPTLWEDDLQSIVQMGIVPNQTQSVPGTLPNAHMKVEL